MSDVTEHGSTSASGAPIPVANIDDPHLREAVADPKRAERAIAVSLLLGIVGVAVFGAAYWQNWKAWTLGVSLGAGLFFIGFAMSAWGKYLMPQGPCLLYTSRCV